MTCEEYRSMDDIVLSLIKIGHYPYQVVSNHLELNICKKTLYNYIEYGIFRKFVLLDIKLRIKLKRKITKNNLINTKKETTKNTRKDVHTTIMLIMSMKTKILIFSKRIQFTVIVQRVHSYRPSNFFLSYSFMFIIYHKEITAKNMLESINLLETILGKDCFLKKL